MDDNIQSVIPKVPKSQFGTLECILEELAVLKSIYKNPSIKQKELVTETGKSLSTVNELWSPCRKRIIAKMLHHDLKPSFVPSNQALAWLSNYKSALNDLGG